MNTTTNPNTNTNANTDIVITKDMLPRVVLGEGITWDYPRTKTGAKAQTQNRWGRFEYDVRVDYSGARLVDVLHHAGTDIKSNAQNNVRPDFDRDSAAVLSAKKATLQKWAAAGRVDLMFTERAKNVYSLDTVAKVQAAVQSAEMSEADLKALEAIVQARLAQLNAPVPDTTPVLPE